MHFYLTIIQLFNRIKVGILPLSNTLREKTCEVLIFPNITNASLISVSQLCDDNCLVLFIQDKLFVIKQNKVIHHGYHNKIDGLWDLNIPLHPTNKITLNMNCTIIRDKTQQDLARYFHAYLFSPSISTLTKAIQNRNLLSWPGIEKLNFSKLIGTTMATELDHLDQERKNLKSTTDLKHEIMETNDSLGTYVNLNTPTVH